MIRYRRTFAAPLADHVVEELRAAHGGTIERGVDFVILHGTPTTPVGLDTVAAREGWTRDDPTEADLENERAATVAAAAVDDRVPPRGRP